MPSELAAGAPRASALRLVRPDRPAAAEPSRRLWAARTAPAAVLRPRLVHALAAAQEPLTVVVAPPGFGKTTLLRQWADADARPVVPLTLDRGHDDPARLARALAEALDDAAGCVAGAPFAIALDDVHGLGAEAIAALTRFADDLGPQARLVLASRTPPPLPLARLRSQRMVSEMGARELARTRPEA